jgi:hypothetical protein
MIIKILCHVKNEVYMMKIKKLHRSGERRLYILLLREGSTMKMHKFHLH